MLGTKGAGSLRHQLLDSWSQVPSAKRRFGRMTQLSDGMSILLERNPASRS